MQTNWEQTHMIHKLLFTLRMATSFGAAGCALLQVFGVWDRAINAAIPLLGISLLIQSVQEWKQSRKTAVVALCAALFVFACTAAAFFGL